MLTVTKDEITKALADAVGPIGKQLAEVREQSVETAKKLDERMAALESGTGEKARDRYFSALQAGKPKSMEPGQTIEEFIEGERAAAAARFVQVNGFGSVPVIDGIPRGLQGVRNASGIMAARLIRAAALCTLHGKQVNAENALEMASRFFGSNDDATGQLELARDTLKKMTSRDEHERQQAERAMGTAVLGSGASFVQPQFWASFLDFLHPMSVVRALGAQSIPLKNGMIFSHFDTAVSASYVGEAAGPNEGSPSDGQTSINRKILAAVVALTNELLEESSFAVDALLRAHLAKALASASDLKFIQGLGTQHQPHGLDYWVLQPTTAHYGNRTLASGSVTYATILRDLMTALQVITDENLPIESSEGAKPGVILTNRERWGLMRVTVGTQEREPFEELKAGTLLGMPCKASTQITKTLAGDGAGSGTNNKSRVYVADFNNLLIAEEEALKIETFRGGAYKDSSGAVVSGITNRETVIAAEQRHELVDTYRGKSIYRIDSVDWGVAF